MTTAAEYLRDRYLKAERPAATQIADAERARDKHRADLHIERVAHMQTRNERDMVTRQLATRSHQNGELKMLVAKAITVLGRHKEHDDCRHLAAELAEKLEALR